jgi:PadR family transcriptional regulator PadR
MVPERSDVLYGSLGLMVLKTLEALGPLHGYRIARRSSRSAAISSP